MLLNADIKNAHMAMYSIAALVIYKDEKNRIVFNFIFGTLYT